MALPDRTVTPTTRRPGLRRGLLAALLAIILLLVLLGGLLAWRPAVLLRAGLRMAGHEEISFDRLRVGLHRLELTGLALGGRSRPEQLVGRLTIDYRPGDLLRGRIEAVSVEGVTLRGRIDQDGLRLEGMDLAAAGSDEAPRLPALPLPERVSIRDVRLELTTPAGVVTVPLEAQLNPQPDRATFVLDAQDAELAAPTGRLQADVHVEGEMPLDMRSLADAITASGRAQLRAEALTLPRVARGIDGAGQLAFSWQHGGLNGTLSDLDAQLESLAPEWATVAQLLPAPWRIELAQPASVSANLVDGGFQLQGSARITLATAGPRLDTTFTTTAALDRHGRIARAGRARRRGRPARSPRRAACGSSAGSIRVQGSWRARGLGGLARAGARRRRHAVARTGARGRQRTGRSGRASRRWPPQRQPARSGHAAARRAELGR